MSNLNNGKMEGDASVGQDPPPYSEKLLSGEPDQRALPAGLSSPMGYAAPLPVPQQYQLCYAPPAVGLSQATVLQPPQTIIITTINPMEEPDYMGFSIFTMLCCFLPLGIAAFVYSIKTRDANRARDGTNARQYSRLARILSYTAFGVGTGITVVCIILKIVLAASMRNYHY